MRASNVISSSILALLSLSFTVACSLTVNVDPLAKKIINEGAALNPDVTTPGKVEVRTGPLPTDTEIISAELFDGDTVQLFPTFISGSNFVDTNATYTWEFVTDTASTLTPSSDTKTADLHLSGTGTYTISVTSNGITKSYQGTISPLPNMVLSATKVTPNTSFSYVDVDVDWDRKIAYASSRKTNNCIDAIDFSGGTPTVVRTIGDATLQNCLGVKLFDNNTKLLASSYSSSKLAAWDIAATLGAPTNWYSMASLSTGGGGKRIAKVINTGLGTWDVFSTRRWGIFNAAMTLTGSPGAYSGSIIIGQSYSLGADEANDSTVLGTHVLLQSSSGTRAIHDLSSDFSSDTTVITTAYNWEASTNADNTKAYLAGGGTGVLFSLSQAGIPQMDSFTPLSGGCVVRSSDFVTYGGKELLYVVCSNYQISVFDVTDSTNPILVRRGSVTGVEGETYAIKAKPNSNLAIIVTNRGDFIVLDLRGIPFI